MRSQAKLALAAVLTVGSLAAAGTVATAGPALAVCPPGNTCVLPPPIPPPPPVVYSTNGTLPERNVSLYPGSNAPGTIQIGARESFTVTATTPYSGDTVALGGEDKFLCQPPSGPPVTYDTVYPLSFTAAPQSVTRQPFSCPSGDTLAAGTYQVYAEAENSSGTVVGRAPIQTFQFTPVTRVTVSVPESSSGVDTGQVLLPGDTVTFAATGQIWAGVILTGTNGPQGWTDYSGCDPKFPLYCAPPYSLIAYLDADGGYYYIGAGEVMSPSLLTAPTKLVLRTNDDAPGNGSGAFSVNIEIDRPNQF